jgi:predicted mannosyl-3-phosphoglycerate phosphatase (HAD superfamily)
MRSLCDQVRSATVVDEHANDQGQAAYVLLASYRAAIVRSLGVGDGEQKALRGRRGSRTERAQSS